MVNVRKPQITGKQLRAARAWVGWTQQNLADRSGISKPSIARLERLETVPSDNTLDTLQRTLEAEGITFLFEGALGTGISMKT